MSRPVLALAQRAVLLLRPRTTARLAVGVLALAVLAAVPSGAGRAEAAFTATTSTTAELTAAVLAGPSDLVATRTCERGAPAFVGATLVTVAGDPSADVALPGGLAVGDLLLAFSITNRSTDGSTSMPATPGGWTRETSQLQSYGASALDRRTVDGSEPADVSFTGLGDAASAVLLLAYRDVDLAASTFASQTQNSGVPHTPAGTVDTVSSTVVDVWLVTSYSGSFATPVGTLRASSATGVGVVAADRPVGTAGATGGTPLVLDAIQRSQTYLSVLVGATPDPAVALTWTPSADNRVAGYGGSRSDVPGAWGTVPGWSTSGYTDTTLPAAQGATYQLWSYLEGWTSAPVSATVAACS